MYKCANAQTPDSVSLQAKCEKCFGSNTAALTKLVSCIRELADVHTEFREVLTRAEMDLCKAAVFPKVHPVVAEFASSSHVITEVTL